MTYLIGLAVVTMIGAILAGFDQEKGSLPYYAFFVALCAVLWPIVAVALAIGAVLFVLAYPFYFAGKWARKYKAKQSEPGEES